MPGEFGFDTDQRVAEDGFLDAGQVGRGRVVKLPAGALTGLAVTEALSLIQTWWATPISQAVADGASIGVGRAGSLS